MLLKSSKIRTLLCLIFLTTIEFAICYGQAIEYFSMTSFKNNANPQGTNTLNKFAISKPKTCQQLKDSFGDIEAMLYDASGQKTISCCRRLFFLISYYVSPFTNSCVQQHAALTNYWPLKNSGVDVVGNINMTLASPSWSQDRNGSSISAVQLSNGGYGFLPSGNYFSTVGFSLMVWVKLLSVKDWQRIIDFGLGAQSDNIILGFRGFTLKLAVTTYYGSQVSTSVSSNDPILLNTWYNIAMTVSGAQLKLYIDGNLVLSSSAYNMKQITRTSCFFVKSNWPIDGQSDAMFNELKFYNIALSQIELQSEMNVR